MKIELAALRPHPQNYNRHPAAQIEKIKRSLARFGQRKPITTWRGMVLTGHGVFEAARALGWSEIWAEPCPEEWTEAEALAWLAADNELARGADPDEDALAALVAGLRDVDAELAALAAGTDERLRELMANLQAQQAGDDPGPQVDKAAELQAKWQTATGQLWQLGEHRLVCGDCTDAAVVARVMGGERARLEFSDPPYEIVTGGGGILKNAAHMKAIAAKGLDSFDPNCLVMLSQTAVFCCNKVLVPAYINLAKSLNVAWDLCFYTKAITPPNYGGHMMTDTEYLMLLGEQSPHVGQEKSLYSKAYFGNRDDDAIVAWQKPIGLLEKFLRLFSSSDDIILDRFLGSGTTLIACERLGRKCRAVEIEPGYVAVALERWATMTGKTPVLMAEFSGANS